MDDLNNNQNQNTSYVMKQDKNYNMQQSSYDPNVKAQVQG